VLAAWRHDVDVSDLVAAALQEVAQKLLSEGHGAHAITVHRNGSWESENVRALAAVPMLEWDFQERARRARREITEITAGEGEGGEQ
jgi:hypothetical protein